MKQKYLNIFIVAPIFVFPIGLLLNSQAAADTLNTTEIQITNTALYEYRPTLNADVVVYSREDFTGNSNSRIFAQRLDSNGQPIGAQIDVSDPNNPLTDDRLNDISGSSVIYTSFFSPPGETRLLLYDLISEQRTVIVPDAGSVFEARIDGNRAVFVEGDTNTTTVKYVETTNTSNVATLSGPAASQVAIGSDLVVWVEWGNEVWAFNPINQKFGLVEESGGSDPSTSGDWVVYEYDNGTEIQIVAKQLSLAPNQALMQVVDSVVLASQADGVSSPQEPDIDGNLVVYGAIPAGGNNYDIYVYQLNERESFQVTNDPTFQRQPSIFGDKVAYGSDSNSTDADIWLSRLEFVPDNLAPLANAGDDQTVHAGSVVTLDGSASSDPDGNYPLAYAWTFTSVPAGSAAALSDPTVVNPSFTADLLGSYIPTLVVTDSLGASSVPDSLLVSTENTAPVADAGPDQIVTLLGSTIHLDGSQSWDDDGDIISYSWTMTAKPTGSSAMIGDPGSVFPMFIADKQGEYVIELVVNDGFASSPPDSVTVSFNNIKPVADAGGNQSVVVGNTVTLNGSGTDANGDLLTYSWNFVSSPAGSTATIVGSTTSSASFTADLPGTYVISLVVNDGILDSDPANVSVTAATAQSEVIDILGDAVVVINDLDPALFKNGNMANALTNKINAVIGMLDQGLYQEALNKLENDILKKTNGCAESGSPDKNDWIKTCVGGQDLVYPFIMDAINLISSLLLSG